MWTTRLRYSGYGLLLVCLTVGLLVAWRVNHVLFGFGLGFIALCVTVVVVARDGWRQTSPENLTSRGFVPESIKGGRIVDPGLRREFAPLVPAAVSRRVSGNRPVRPSVSVAAVKEPAPR
ncbi:MAG: hypothetical protein ACRDP7_02145, partial [Trebonia sp.]